jgi:hypothetical protein
MRQNVITTALLIALLVPAAAPAQDKKPAPAKPGPAMVMEAKDVGVKGKNDKPDPKLAKDRVLAVGQFYARVTEYDEDGGKMKLVVPYRVPVLNTDAVARLGELQQEYLNAALIEDVQERFQEVLRIQGEIVQTRAALYTLEEHEADVELPLDEDVKVRLLQPPPKFDDKGNIQKYTAKELEELRAPANLPGYRGERDELRDKIWIQATVVRKKSDPTAPRLSMVVILGDVAE